MPGYALNESMLSGFFFDGRKVSPSPEVPTVCDEFSASSRQTTTSAGKLNPFSSKHKAACRAPSQSQVCRLLNGFRKDSDEASNFSRCGSDESEGDLAAMVHDFIENGNSAHDFSEQVESDAEIVNILKLNESLQALFSAVASYDRDLFSTISAILGNVSAGEFPGHGRAQECKGSCIRQLLVKNMKLNGYNAALCKVKWSNSGRVPGGEYEYIDIVPDRSSESSDRVIIDTDFRSQFEIARPVAQYEATLKLLPVIFVGKESKLEQVLQIMCKASKYSLKQNSMPLPPWRSLDYMKAKWFSASQRCQSSGAEIEEEDPPVVFPREAVSGSKRCEEQLAHLKNFLKKETDAGFTTLKSITHRGKIFMRAKPSCWS